MSDVKPTMLPTILKHMEIKLYACYAIFPWKKRLRLGDLSKVEETADTWFNKYILQECQCLGPWFRWRRRSLPAWWIQRILKPVLGGYLVLRAQLHMLEGCVWWWNDCRCECCQGVAQRKTKMFWRCISLKTYKCRQNLFVFLIRCYETRQWPTEEESGPVTRRAGKD